MLLKKEEVIKMFQNINETEKTKEEIGSKKSILANVISKKYIILYILYNFTVRLTLDERLSTNF